MMQGDKIWAKGEDPRKMAEVRLTKCQSVGTNRPTTRSKVRTSFFFLENYMGRIEISKAIYLPSGNLNLIA